MKRLFVIVFCFLFLHGCSTITFEEMQSDVANYSLPKRIQDDKGIVYIVRPSNLGMAIRFNVFLDDKTPESEMGYTRGNQYIYFYVEPGNHVISSKAENWADISINIKAGEIIFILQEPNMGFIMAGNTITKLSDVEGKYYVKHAKLGTVIKEYK